MSKRVLMVTRAFYPNNVTGSHRPAKLAKYLPKFGWTPVVVCADWTAENSQGCYDPGLAARPDVCRTVRVPYNISYSLWGKVVNRLTRALWPYKAPLGLYRNLRAAAEELVAEEPFDAIWSTFMPGLTHSVACRVSRQHGIPWVADFRDLPDQTYDTARGRRWVRIERKVCRHAAALVTVSPDLVERLAGRYDAPVHAIMNGFDPDNYPPSSVDSSEKFTIRYFGRLYPHRHPGPLFEAIDMLTDKGTIAPGSLGVEFYGTNPRDVAARSIGYKCAEIVECRPRVSIGEMVRLQQSATVLLLLKSSEAGSVPAKVFDYLGVRRPILNVPGDGTIVDGILAETQAGVSSGDTKQIAEVLQEWYDEWQATGWVRYRGVPDKLLPYTREYQAGQLAQVLDSVCGSSDG